MTGRRLCTLPLFLPVEEEEEEEVPEGGREGGGGTSWLSAREEEGFRMKGSWKALQRLCTLTSPRSGGREGGRMGGYRG